MQAFEGAYRVQTFCRHSGVDAGDTVEWQARADIYRWNDKAPIHCIYSATGFVSCEAAKFIALNKGVNWARARSVTDKAAADEAARAAAS